MFANFLISCKKAFQSSQSWAIHGISSRSQVMQQFMRNFFLLQHFSHAVSDGQRAVRTGREGTKSKIEDTEKPYREAESTQMVFLLRGNILDVRQVYHHFQTHRLSTLLLFLKATWMTETCHLASCLWVHDIICDSVISPGVTWMFFKDKKQTKECFVSFEEL